MACEILALAREINGNPNLTCNNKCDEENLECPFAGDGQLFPPKNIEIENTPIHVKENIIKTTN